MYRLSELKELLLEIGVSPKKALGQNFLINDNVCQKICDEALSGINENVLNKDPVIEVGPGLGALTNKILEAGKKLHLIELDRNFCNYWRGRGLEVTEADALQVDWGAFSGAQVLVSNLPYQISSSLVIDRSIQPFEISKMVLMFQKEVAQRITARPETENYGMLSVIAQSFWDISLLIEVGPKDFYPPPKVASRVLVFKRKTKLPNRPGEFLKFVKQAFSQRRKLLAKNLGAMFLGEKILKALTQLGIDSKVRAEELNPTQFQLLFDLLVKNPEGN